MYYLNGAIHQRGSLTDRITELCMPQTYVAASISEFVKGRAEVRMTEWWRILPFTLTGQKGGHHVVGKAVIMFSDLTYSRHENTVCLRDSTHQLEAAIFPQNVSRFNESVQLQGIRNGDRVQLIEALYDPRADGTSVIGIQKIVDMESADRYRHGELTLAAAHVRNAF